LNLSQIFQQLFCSPRFYNFSLQLGNAPWKLKKPPRGTVCMALAYQPISAIAFQKRFSERQESSELRVSAL